MASKYVRLEAESFVLWRPRGGGGGVGGGWWGWGVRARGFEAYMPLGFRVGMKLRLWFPKALRISRARACCVRSTSQTTDIVRPTRRSWRLGVPGPGLQGALEPGTLILFGV